MVSHCVPSVKLPAEPGPRSMVSGNSEEGEEQKSVPSCASSWHRRKAPATPEHLQLLNRFTAIKAEELGVLSSRAYGPTDPEPARSTRRKMQPIVVSDSLLQAIDAPDITCYIKKFAASQGLRSRCSCN